ncbi:hypothetical protein Q8A67_022351 [Cirrhinus molitorella]|uniref:Uncharacterized protein n=1 Tax=Cirrhinus molitorella TaxID=172907 RepID=A0AA88P7V5_9TELE|nr:hypothetical protein Q8A67_022351 [Cirrhinus molitorella]
MLSPRPSARFHRCRAVAGGFAHLSNTFPGEQSGALWGQTPRHHSHCKEPSGADMTARFQLAELNVFSIVKGFLEFCAPLPFPCSSS